MGGAFGLGCFSSLTPLLPTAALFSSVPTIVAEPATDEAPEQQTAAAGRSLEAIVAAAPVTDAESYNKAELARFRPLTAEVKVKSGDTLTNMLVSTGVPITEAHSIVELVKPVYDPRKLDIGKSLTVQLSKNTEDGEQASVQSVNLPISVTSTLEVTRKADDSFSVKQIDIPVERKLAHAGGRITSSLYETGTSTGLPPVLINEIINAYSYDVDFQREIKHGDNIDVLFEQLQTADGTPAGSGNVIYAELGLGDRTLKVYRYTGSDGQSDYYNEKGESVRKALLRTPINGAKITSGFGMRNHPVMGYSKMHRGVDFGAPTGTPIYAAGDGTVAFVGTKGGYGNYVRLKHNGQYDSAYAHMSRFATGIAPGRKVKQGQIIGYVGSTGMSTGPHLHYEILANNEQVNPANVKFKTGNILQGKELLAFRQNMQKVEAKLASLQRNKMDVAMNDSKSNPKN